MKGSCRDILLNFSFEEKEGMKNLNNLLKAAQLASGKGPEFTSFCFVIVLELREAKFPFAQPIRSIDRESSVYRAI